MTTAEKIEQMASVGRQLGVASKELSAFAQALHAAVEVYIKPANDR